MKNKLHLCEFFFRGVLKLHVTLIVTGLRGSRAAVYASRAKDVQERVPGGRPAQPMPACQGRPQPSTFVSVGTQIFWMLFRSRQHCPGHGGWLQWCWRWYLGINLDLWTSLGRPLLYYLMSASWHYIKPKTWICGSQPSFRGCLVAGFKMHKLSVIAAQLGAEGFTDCMRIRFSESIISSRYVPEVCRGAPVHFCWAEEREPQGVLSLWSVWSTPAGRAPWGAVSPVLWRLTPKPHTWGDPFSPGLASARSLCPHPLWIASS